MTAMASECQVVCNVEIGRERACVASEKGPEEVRPLTT